MLRVIALLVIPILHAVRHAHWTSLSLWKDVRHLAEARLCYLGMSSCAPPPNVCVLKSGGWAHVRSPLGLFQDSTEYELVAVVAHTGQLEGGHYVA